MDYLSKTIDLCDRRQAITPDNRPSNGAHVKIEKEEIEQSIPERFEKIVQMYPDRLALKTPYYSLKYSELNATANRVARALLEQRISDAKPVGLLFEKDAPLIAAMLGVLKTGKFFVLLDPSLPKQRLATMLRDSEAELVLTDQQNISLAREVMASEHKLLEFAAIDHTIPAENLALSISPETLAFITYTSGSTGQAKGVVQNQQNFLFYFVRYTRAHGFCEQDIFSLLQSGTSSSITIAFCALLNGATLLPFDVRKRGVNELVDWLLRERISVCHISSPLYRSFCETLTGKETFSNLRLIRLNGETVHKSDLELYKKYFPTTCALVNGLASSETGTVRLYFMNHETNITGDEIPVGYPIEGSDILLMNDAGKKVGFDEIGEIVVKSAHLSPGYWRRPDLTEAKFKLDSQGTRKRLYHTGDLGLMRSDGCLIHKGRKDFRVKIRGFGVDILEIEQILREHDAIGETVVVLGTSEFSESRLIAYFISHVPSPPSVSELRSYLSNKLPDYMVPSFFVRLDAMPLTPNGKIDRGALPDPDKLRPNLNVPFVAPSTAVEKRLAKIWAEVLGVERVGIQDNFFDLGGHSLLAARLFLRIKKTFSKELSPSTLFNAPTIEKLAEIIRQDGARTARSLLVPIQTDGSKPPFFWACGYSSDIFLPRYLGQDQPLYGLLNQCHDGKRPAYGRLEDMAAHYLKEIRAIQPQGPYYLGGLCFGGMVAFEMARQLKQQSQDVALLFLLDLATINNCKVFLNRHFASRQPLPEIESCRDKVSRHLGKLSTLAFRERLKYVLVRVADRFSGVIGAGKNIAERLIQRYCLVTRQPIPLSFRVHYIVAVDVRVLKDYDPQVYRGRIVHIKAEASAYDPHLVEKLTSGDVEMHEVACNHSELLKESHIGLWADALKRSLSKAQANTLSKGDDCSVSPARDFKAKAEQF